MQAKTSPATTTCPKTMAGRLRVACRTLVRLLLVLTLPAAVQAQWEWETNYDGTVTITRYTGPAVR